MLLNNDKTKHLEDDLTAIAYLTYYVKPIVRYYLVTIPTLNRCYYIKIIIPVKVIF